MRPAKRLLEAGLLACLLGTSCSTTSEPWLFAVSRCAEDAGYWSFGTARGGWTGIQGDGRAALVAVAAAAGYMVFPVAIDVAILPVTGVHDLFFLDDSPW